MLISKSASTNCPRFPESSKRVGPACFYTSVCPVLKRPGQHSGNQYLSGRLGRLCRAGNRVEAQLVLAGRPDVLLRSSIILYAHLYFRCALRFWTKLPRQTLKILPGFKISLGSSARLMARIMFSSTGSVTFSMAASFLAPMACSPDRRPPRLYTYG